MRVEEQQTLLTAVNESRRWRF